MNTLIVTANPYDQSLAHRAASHLVGLVGPDATTAHLAQEGFDPRFTLNDRLVYKGEADYDDQIKTEQRRVEAADHLVLAFPMYWWSMPALLKGWIDRVFMGKWAFAYDAENNSLTKRLSGRTVHLLAIGNSSEERFERHGYRTAFRTQVEEGIVEYSGLTLGRTEFIFESDSADEAVDRSLETAVTNIAAAIKTS